MMSEQVRQDLAKHLPDYQIPEDGKLPLEIYSWLVCNVWAPTRANWTDEEIIADFMNNEGRQTEEWPDFGAATGICRKANSEKSSDSEVDTGPP